jgi:23S rRNA (cytosine1962-C5)-methyltransferase
VSLEDFLGTLDDATLGRDDLRILEIASAGVDHPVLPAFPEGRYLEFVVLG